MKTSASQGWPGEHGVGGHHQIAAMRTRIPSGPVFDTAAWRGRVRACGSRRGERRGGGPTPASGPTPDPLGESPWLCRGLPARAQEMTQR